MKETKELVLFVCAVASQIVESQDAEGGLQFTSAADFIDELIEAPDALKGISEIPEELKTATTGERAELYELISDRVQDITDDKIDKIVEAVETIAVAVDEVINQLKE
jgi:hypothetical protein